MNAIILAGPLANFRSGCILDPSRNWVLYYPLVTHPKQFNSFQSAVLSALSVDSCSGDIGHDLHSKLVITLKSVSGRTHIPPGWQSQTFKHLGLCTSFVKMCWLKSVVGGWCTGVRLHSFHGRLCIFGCVDCKDDMLHYLECTILWQIAREVLQVRESSICILERLCIVDPSEEKFVSLAFCHALYHACVNDTRCVRADGTPCCSQVVQLRAWELAHECKYMVGGT